ncbi:MAG: DinB family protein [Cyclobacteriaceae bacterium]
MKNFTLTLLFLSLSFAVIAQSDEPQSQFAKDFLHVWSVSSRITIEVAEAMPEELYGYKPSDSSKTFGDQIAHIAFTCGYLSNGFVNSDWGEYKDPDTQDMTKAEVIELLKQNLEVATQNIASMTDEQANETIKAFGGRMLKRYITILFIQDHLTNHRAKANLYIRMNNIKPPEYGFFN